MGYKLDSAGNVPTNASALSLVNISSLSGAAQATSKLSIQANLQSSSTVDADLHRRRHDIGHGDAGLPAHHQCL